MTHACRDRALEVSPEMQEPLRDCQQRLVDAASTGNHLIVLPTGAGKTRIAIELAARILQADLQSHIVFLADNRTLALQQQGRTLSWCSHLCLVLTAS